MEIKQIKKIKKNTYQIQFTNQKEIVLYDDIIVKYSLIPKKKISELELEKIIKENNALASYYKALSYLSIRLRTEKEIKQYLEKNNYEKETITKTIEKLKKDGYLKEEEYIRCYINDTLRFSKDGPLKIKKKLQELGCTKEKIEEALAKLPKEEWISKLEKLYQKKGNSKHTDGLEKWRQKCNNYFYTLGYPKEWIEEISSNIEMPEDNLRIQNEYEKYYRKWSRKLQGKELDFKIKIKLYEKGFSKEMIENIMAQKK